MLQMNDGRAACGGVRSCKAKASLLQGRVAELYMVAAGEVLLDYFWPTDFFCYSSTVFCYNLFVVLLQ